jgi:hypothetical protein
MPFISSPAEPLISAVEISAVEDAIRRGWDPDRAVAPRGRAYAYEVILGK